MIWLASPDTMAFYVSNKRQHVTLGILAILQLDLVWAIHGNIRNAVNHHQQDNQRGEHEGGK